MEVCFVRGEREKRILKAAEYIVEHRATVRETAKIFGVSKSTIHKDVTERVARLDSALAREAAAVLSQNKAERHLRGGAATREKYRACGTVKKLELSSQVQHQAKENFRGRFPAKTLSWAEI